MGAKYAIFILKIYKLSSNMFFFYRSVCQDLALSLAGDMFGLLLERCNLLVARGDPGVVLEPSCQLEEDLCNLLAPVKAVMRTGFV